MKHRIGGVALVALTATTTACGTKQPDTLLLIDVGARVYRLQCAPPGGTAPQPARICAELRRSPNLLVGGAAIAHSCPAGEYASFRVSGTYRGRRVEATFPPSSCAWVPGQGNARDVWSFLMQRAGDGEPESRFASLRVSASMSAGAELRKLRLKARRLIRRRRMAVAAGTLRLSPGAPPDDFALAALRAQEEASNLQGPEIAHALLYSTTQHQAGRAINEAPPKGSDSPVYVVVYRFAYRDWRGRKHVAEGSWWAVYDARTLDLRADGGVDGLDVRSLGRPVKLR